MTQTLESTLQELEKWVTQNFTSDATVDYRPYLGGTLITLARTFLQDYTQRIQYNLQSPRQKRQFIARANSLLNAWGIAVEEISRTFPDTISAEKLKTLASYTNPIGNPPDNLNYHPDWEQRLVTG
ncbi:MAG: hypothetical protein Q7S76_02205 [bacterium]|nr:hypothetical protein [bacterium]